MHHAETTVDGALELPPKVTLSPLPVLYNYDHCPFCVRVRVALGLKNVKHELRFLMNDDVDTPTALVGKKMVPILTLGRPGEAGYEVLKESLDIVARIDSDPQFGPPGVIKAASERTDIDEWIKKGKVVMRRLTSPRYVRAPLPEFHLQDGRDAYIRNHKIPEPSDYDANFEMTAELLPEANDLLRELEPMIFSEMHVSEAGISYDDIVLFSRLRSWTLIKGLVWPPKVKAYVDFYTKTCDIPSYELMAM